MKKQLEDKKKKLLTEETAECYNKLSLIPLSSEQELK